MAGDVERIDRLEMRLAEQGRVIDDLDAAVAAQWSVIDGLRRRLELCADRLAEAERRLPPAPEAAPPHY